MGTVIAFEHFYRKPKIWRRLTLSGRKHHMSKRLKASSGQKSRMDRSNCTKLNGEMEGQARRFREAVVERLNILSEVLCKDEGEIARAIGATPRDWSNWRKSGGKAKIPPARAWELCKVFSLSMDWIYGGDIGQIQQESLRARIVAAERQMGVRPEGPFHRRFKAKRSRHLAA